MTVAHLLSVAEHGEKVYRQPMTFLFAVEDCFEVQGRGLVVVFPPGFALEVTIRISDKVQLRTPDGRVIDTCVRGLGSVRCAQPPRRRALILGKECTKREVTAGTEVWHEASASAK